MTSARLSVVRRVLAVVLLVLGTAGTAVALAHTGGEAHPALAAGGADPPLPPRTPKPKPTPTPHPGRRAFVPVLAQEPPSTPVPRPGRPGPGLEPLQARMQEVMDAFPVAGYYAVAVTDLQTGATASINGNRPHIAGCIFNAFAYVSAMLDVRDGAYPASRVEALGARMFLSSDTSAAHALYTITGGGDVDTGIRKVGRLVGSMGMQHSILDHAPGYPWETLGIDPNNWITADDVNQALAALYAGNLLEDPYRTHVLDAMSRVEPRLNYLLGTIQDEGALVSHKNGWLYEDGWVDNDAGIVRFYREGEEYAFAFAFLAMDVEPHLADVPLGQALVRIAWEFFKDAYPERVP